MLKNPTSFDEFITSQLNTNQQKAVSHKNGVLVVCAGAGSGKTRVITARIANLILKENVNPSSIIALTFTNKAGKEMKERIKNFLDTRNEIELPFIGTFHSYCLRLLKSNPDFYDGSFSLLDQDDQIKLLRDILKKLSIEKKLTPKKASSAISHIKNHALDLQQIGDPLIRTVFIQYETEKKASRALDFDDLLLEALKLFKKNKKFKELFQSQVRHVLVDEYQDTNHVQHELLKQMSLEKNKLTVDSVCVVGDEDQSIYSWRGATVTNILDFGNDFPGTKHITIDQNYRSVTPILETANHVIKNNSARREKKLWSERKAKDRIRLLQCASEHHESAIIAAGIKEASMHYDPSKLAVLYRSHYQSRSIEESLIRHAIPYRIVGGIQFYERAEVKDLIAYLRLAVNPFDRVSFSRIINTPARGLGQKFIELFMEIWNQNLGYTFQDTAQHLIKEKLLTKSKESALHKILELYESLDTSQATQCIETIIDKIEYSAYIRTTHEDDEAQSKLENVQEFIQALYYFQDQGITTLADILDEISLMQDMSSKKHDDNCVKLMTIHAAKGLEFANVFLVGLEDGVFPSSRSMFDEIALEEERRLMYVALTRAEERIFMTYARYRTTYGQMNAQGPSRFLKEMPSYHVNDEDASHWTQMQTNEYLSSWFSGIYKAAKKEQAPSLAPESFSFSMPKPQGSTNAWKQHQPVNHPQFGIGLIEKIEKKGNDKTFLTIRFKTAGRKKIDASFL